MIIELEYLESVEQWEVRINKMVFVQYYNRKSAFKRRKPTAARKAEVRIIRFI